MADYDAFKEAFEKGYGANKLAIQKEVESTEDTIAKLRAYKDKSDQAMAREPLANWANKVEQPAGMALSAPAVVGGAAGYNLLRPGGLVGTNGPALSETIDVNPSVSDNSEYQKYGVAGPGPEAGPPSQTDSSLPNAHAAFRTAMGPGMGPGGDTGTEKAVRSSQLDYLADLGGLQAKKEETYGAHLQGLQTAADLQQEAVDRGKVAAQAYQDSVDEDQRAREAKDVQVQQANDEATAKGIDPGKFYRNRNVGFWINMFIGSIAGGMEGAMNHSGRNQFMDSMDKMVEQDIHAQEVGIEQGLRKAKNAETGYERMRMRGIDKVTASFKQHDWTMNAIEGELKARIGKAQIPEEAKRLEEALQEVQIKRDQETTKYNEYWNSIAHQRASAAAALANAQIKARRDAENHAMEMELKRSQAIKNYAEADKERGAGKDKSDQEARFIAEKEQSAGLPGLEATVQGARLQHEKAPITTSQRVLDFQAHPTLYKAMFGKDAAEREQAWAGTVAQVRHELAGANVSPSEAKPITAMLEGAGDQESRMFAIKQAQQVIEAKRANIRATAPDTAKQMEANKKDMPTVGIGSLKTFKPKE